MTRVLRDAPAVPAAAGPRTAGDVMTTALVTVSPDDSLVAAWELLSRGRFRHLPVVERGRCLGVLDDRTLAVEWLVRPEVKPRRPVGEMLRTRTPHVVAETPLRRVAQLMVEEGVSAVPVVDGALRLVGLVTERDVVAAYSLDW